MEHLAVQLTRCLEAYDREGAVAAILAAVEEGLPIEELYGGVLEPFLRTVGTRWQGGDTAVWEEHLIVGAIRTAVDALYPAVLKRKAEVKPLAVTVAFFCPPEESHDLGLRMLADRFDLRGFRTVYVGALTPVAEMIECAKRVSADVVCLSASTHFQRAALADAVRVLREQLPAVRIVVGGAAFVHSTQGWEDYTVHSVDALLDELAEWATAGAGGGPGAGARA